MWDLERLSGFIWQRKRLEIYGLWFDESRGDETKPDGVSSHN